MAVCGRVFDRPVLCCFFYAVFSLKEIVPALAVALSRFPYIAKMFVEQRFVSLSSLFNGSVRVRRTV
jgi:hypothetical protein